MGTYGPSPDHIFSISGLQLDHEVQYAPQRSSSLSRSKHLGLYSTVTSLLTCIALLTTPISSHRSASLVSRYRKRSINLLTALTAGVQGRLRHDRKCVHTLLRLFLHNPLSLKESISLARIATTLISRVMLNIRDPERRTRSFYWLSNDHEV